jgi:murein DD-endopeptidase MepM/ murein hydrolase activator NlpD
MNNVYNPGPGFSPSSPYALRTDPMTGNTVQFHSGQDFRAAAGTPIPAAATGEVVYSGFNTNLGNTVIVQNEAGAYSLYAHMQPDNLAQLGQQVWQGDTIGQVGSTGARTTGDHLHYSVITDEAGRNITITNDGGPLNIALNSTTTVNPSQYSNYNYTPPYLDQTLRAAAENRGFCFNSALKTVEPDRGRPEIR